ncbi:MAG: peptide-N4-asparagine amidase [Thermoplasmataceae archaeon]
MVRDRKKLLIAVFIASIMILSSIFVLASSGNVQGNQTASPSVSNVQTKSIAGQTPPTPSIQSVLSKIYSRGIPNKYVYLPNFNAANMYTYTNGHVTPLYSQSPAPMGIGDFGLKAGPGGSVIPYTLNTTSVEGSISLSNLNAFYLQNDGPQSVTVQLNTVLNNVTLFGNSSYVFWNQNVIFYSARTHQLEFIDNVWNFSSSSFNMTPNAIAHGDGTVVPYVYYFAIGPSFTVKYPFTIDLYLTAAVVNGDSTAFFNFTVHSQGKTMSGSFDEVMFNSTYGMPAGYSAPKPHYMISGTQITPTGYLLNDAEIMIGGPGGGSTTSVYGISGSMSLKYTPEQASAPAIGQGSHPLSHVPGGMGSMYVSVPSAYDFGTDTGETSEGVAVSWNRADTAQLSAGPSLLYGMWGIYPPNTQMVQYRGTVSPSNAFMFVSQGNMFNAESAAWVPLSLNGGYNFLIPSGSYSAEALLSNYNPQMFLLAPGAGGGGMKIALHFNPAMGIYTPLVAMDNQQLKYVSLSGSGTSRNPYMLDNYQPGSINPLFAEFNDFAFPVFTGVLLVNTNAYVEMNGMPFLFIQYPAYLHSFLNALGLPSFNYMGYGMYGTEHVSLFGSNITGWFSRELAGFPVANVMVWNSSYDLIGGNTFMSMDSSVLIFGGSSNTVWGNTFENYTNSGLNASESTATNLYGAPLGISVYSNGNVIYNNIFNSTITAYSPSFSIYTGEPAQYMNQWNVSLRPSSYVETVNGYELTGSIVGGQYQGGNYWWNFNGIIPYNNSGAIEFGGDYEPLNLLMVTYGPLVPAPLDAIVVVPVYAAYVSHSTTSTIVNSSVFFPVGSYSRITVTFFDQYISNPFDDSFIVQVNDTQILAGNTLELENTSVTEAVTQYYSILQGPATVTSLSPQFNPGYASRLSTWFTFYVGQEASHPQRVIPAFTDIGFPTPRNPPVNVLVPYNVTKTTNVTFPDNVTSAYLNLYEQQNGNDEFWYANEPPFREFRMYIGTQLIGMVEPYPNVQTGGGDLFLWQPILAIGAELYPPHRISLTPYLSLLHGKQQISIEVINDENLWVRTALNFMINTTSSSANYAGLVSQYTFTNNYIQTPPTNLTTKSIPFSATYLNDSEYVNESISSSGVSTVGSTVITSAYDKTVTFFSNSSEFNPNANIVIPTSTGFEIPIVEYFFLNETTTELSTTTYQYINAQTHAPSGFVTVRNYKQEYYQINGASTEDLYINASGDLVGIGIGFNVTQVRIIQDLMTVNYYLNGSYGSFSTFSYNDTQVVGLGFFVGTLNSESELTSLTYNNAKTVKTISSYSEYDGHVVAFYTLYEEAVNNSLINRNGQIIVYMVRSGN